MDENQSIRGRIRLCISAYNILWIIHIRNYTNCSSMYIIYRIDLKIINSSISDHYSDMREKYGAMRFVYDSYECRDFCIIVDANCDINRFIFPTYDRTTTRKDDEEKHIPYEVGTLCNVHIASPTIKVATTDNFITNCNVVCCNAFFCCRTAVMHWTHACFFFLVSSS